VLRRLCCFALIGMFSAAPQAQDFGWVGTNSLALPQIGEHRLRILTPTILELTLITTRKNESSPVSEWDFVGPKFAPKIPDPAQFRVLVDGKQVAVQRVGFKRRPLYAPLNARDLRILNQLYLEISDPIRERQRVEVQSDDPQIINPQQQFKTVADPFRFNPAIHVNQVGYAPAMPKRAMVGYYLGTAGELKVAADQFTLIDTTGNVAFQGKLRRRPDVGFTYSPTPYQNVLEADFSEFQKPGIYRLAIPGMGASFPFRIEEGILGAFARTYALGLYHQRCGTNNAIPFTRHTHEACHLAPAEVLTKAHKNAQRVIAEVSSDAKQDPRHTAPQLKNSDASLYPFGRPGKVDVSGGHHDAGDYSKYTINSAGLIHSLVFAADNFKDAGELDNLGLPESGDAKSDLLQEAKWEAEFLAKMQDTDGGFYFLVYPKDRRYEDNVLPDKGDPQIVWPKNTTATAVAVAALSEIGSSPTFKKQFPEAAKSYLAKALRGWAFLENAIKKHGRDGAYQKLTHYGNEFFHDDELGWAAAALFAATGNKQFEKRFIESFNPEDTKTRRWSWWPMFEGWGNATRTYVFAARNGRIPSGQADSGFLMRCESLIHATAMNQVRFARETAYGTSFPDPNKANKNAGWFFSTERAFDIVVAYQLRPDEALLDAIVSNLNYEAGCNPVNVSFITGLGWRRQRELVHQYAQNDQRVLPPSGIPIGNIQGGFADLEHYKKDLGALPFPPDGAETAPYPFYDRWGDSFNTTTEFVVTDLGRSLGTTAFLMAQSKLKDQPWRSMNAKIVGLPRSGAAGETVKARLEVEGFELDQAQTVWEARDQEPVIARELIFAPRNVGEQWIEAEVLLPDGRRVFAKTAFSAAASMKTPPNAVLSTELASGAEVVALFHLNDSLQDEKGRAPALQLAGKAASDSSNLSWMARRGGAALRFKDLGDKATTSVDLRNLPGGISELTLQAMLYINSFKGFNKGNAKILSLSEDWNSSVEFIENLYEGPMVKGGTQFSIDKNALTNALSLTNWHHISISLDREGYTCRVNGKVVKTVPAREIDNWGRKPAALEVGNFDGYIDEIAVLVKGREEKAAP
jgi:hypothetical protein